MDPDAGGNQATRDLRQVKLVPGVERDGDRAWQRSGLGGLAGGVKDLCALLAVGEVSADDHVVDRLEGGDWRGPGYWRTAEQLAVNACSETSAWPRGCQASRA